MKLNLQEVNEMIKSQKRVIESRLERLKMYQEIDINDYFLNNIKYQIEIGKIL